MNSYFKEILFGILSAIFFSAFIYLAEYKIEYKLLDTTFALLALGMLLYIPRKSILVSGFFIGLFWFYWIGYSFEYQGVGYMTPIIIISFGFIYSLFFAPLYFTKKAYIRALLLFGLSFVEPFNWNWLKIELLFVNSYIGIYKYQLFLVLLALSLPSISNKNYLKIISIVLLILSINFKETTKELAPLKIKLVETKVAQEEKWLESNLYPTIKLNFSEIEKAIANMYDIVVLPESVFPFYMNLHQSIIDRLKEYSKSITIVTGTLLYENNKNYNVTYIFENQHIKIAKKLVLVPFGEYIPLPKFAQKFINDTFFSGASDFTTAKKPTDFIIRGIKFRNAICYEATCDELYSGDVKYMIAISNNAWFAPSIEPTLQRLLMKFYAKKFNVIIYHSANYKGSGIIKP